MANDFRVLEGLLVEDAAGYQARFTHYYGSPDGAVVAPLGSICTDTSTGKVYRKAIGADHHGWSEIKGAESFDLFDWKTPVLAVAVADHGLSGTADIDGQPITAGARIGVVGQTDPEENGIYIAAAGGWARATDANENTEINAGMAFAVIGGSTYGGSVWLLTTTGAIDIGTTELAFAQINPVYSGSTAGGIAVSNHVFSIEGFTRGTDALTAATPAVLDTVAYKAAIWRIFARTTAGTSMYSAEVHAVNTGDAGAVDYSVSNILRVGALTLTIAVTNSSGNLVLTVTPSATGVYAFTREAISLA